MNLKAAIDKFYYDLVINELRIMNMVDSDANITYNSLLYLDLISYKENCTVSMLADILHVARSAVTIKVKELEKLDLIEKHQSSEDKRVFYLTVTDKAQEMYRIYETAFENAANEINMNYSKSEVEQFSKMLSVFSTHYNKTVKHEVNQR